MFSYFQRLFGKKPRIVAASQPVKRKYKSAAVFKPLVWIDCEMTGLDISRDHIIEICCIITDGNLNILDEKGYESTVYVPKKVLDNMGEWCVKQHGQSGLTAKVLANPQQTLAKVQKELLEYIQSYVSEPRTSLLAGNSIHMDKFFMMREFPQVIDHLHYRLVDVSSIMEVGFRHNPALMKMFPKKKGAHTARMDILESINQLRWYRDHYLRSGIPESLKLHGDDGPDLRDEVLNAQPNVASKDENRKDTNDSENSDEPVQKRHKPCTFEPAESGAPTLAGSAAPSQDHTR